MRLLVNLIAFQIGWFACVMGAAYGFYWVGPMVVVTVFGLHLYLTDCYKRECLIGLVFLIAGFTADTVLTAWSLLSGKTFCAVPHQSTVAARLVVGPCHII